MAVPIELVVIFFVTVLPSDLMRVSVTDAPEAGRAPDIAFTVTGTDSRRL